MATTWAPQPGPQTAAMLTDADEILLGGARGGGKTLAGILWLTKGEYSAPKDSPLYQTALNHPRYTALVVRRQAQDLRDWIDQANEIYRDMGATLVGNPPMFVWKQTGAKIYMDHLGDEAAYNKYRGWSLHRILIEELTEIPQAKWFLRLLGSLRSKKNDEGKAFIQPQLLATTNPDGPGRIWVNNRYVNLHTAKGGRARRWDNDKQQFTVQDIKPGVIPPCTLVVDPITKLARIFIPAVLDDNKYLGEEYERMLLAQRAESEATYQAWRFGRWDVFSGQFFDSLRLEGPRPDEPPYASHTFDLADVVLADWWPVTIGVDWGFNHEAATYWGRWSQMDKRLYVYREFVTRQMGSRQLGQEIARRTLPDLIGLSDSPHIPLWLSHDAFSKEDATKTKAELFIDGINDVLGAGSAHIAELTDAEKRMAPADAFASMEQRYTALQNGPCITVHRARQDRAAMASYVREMLSWQVLEKKEPDIEYARQLLASGAQNGRGHELYEEYMARFRNQNQDPVPKVKIERNCTKLRDCLVSLVYDPKNTEVPLKIDSTPEGEPGDDPYDGFCHLLMGARFSANRKPRGVFVQERLDRLRSIHGANVDPAIVHQVLAKAAEDWNGQQSDGQWMSLNRLN